MKTINRFICTISIAILLLSCNSNRIKVNPQEFAIIDIVNSDYILERVHLDFGDITVKRAEEFVLFQDYFVVKADGQRYLFNRAGVIDTTLSINSIMERYEQLYKNDLFVSSPTCDTIRSMSGDQINQVEYVVDFGSFAFRPEGINFSNEYEKLQYLNILDNREKYASLISNLSQDSKNLYFTYYFGYARNFIGIYNKSKKRVNSYLIADLSREESVQVKLMRVYDGDLYILIQMPHVNGNNPVIVRLRIDN